MTARKYRYFLAVIYARAAEQLKWQALSAKPRQTASVRQRLFWYQARALDYLSKALEEFPSTKMIS